MKIIKKSKSKNTQMNKYWLKSAGLDHFWMIWRFRCLINLLNKNKIKIHKNLKIMDLGCGNGVLSNQLEKLIKIKIDRVDSNKETLQKNKNVKGRLICYGVEKKTKKLRNYYDIILLFDVLEHIKNDKVFFKNILYHLKNNGYLIINVPSLQLFYSLYDVAVGHIRRYNKKGFKKLINNFKVNLVDIKYWGIFLLPILFIRKIILIFQDKKDLDSIVKKGWETSYLINNIMKLAMFFETKIIKNPILGSSMMMIIKKK